MPMNFEGLHSGQFTLFGTTTAVVETSEKTVIQTFGNILLTIEFHDTEPPSYQYVVDPDKRNVSVKFGFSKRDAERQILGWGYTKRMHFATNPNYYISVVAQLSGGMGEIAILTICLWSDLTDHGKELMAHGG